MPSLARAGEEGRRGAEPGGSQRGCTGVVARRSCPEALCGPVRSAEAAEMQQPGPCKWGEESSAGRGRGFTDTGASCKNAASGVRGRAQGRGWGAEPPRWSLGPSLALPAMSPEHAGQLQGGCVAPHGSVCHPTRPPCPSHHSLTSVPGGSRWAAGLRGSQGQPLPLPHRSRSAKARVGATSTGTRDKGCQRKGTHFNPSSGSRPCTPVPGAPPGLPQLHSPGWRRWGGLHVGGAGLSAWSPLWLTPFCPCQDGARGRAAEQDGASSTRASSAG